MITKGHKAFLWGDENVLKLTVVMVTELCENTKNHQTVHFKWVNCMICELHLKKTVTKGSYAINRWMSQAQWWEPLPTRLS